jgi:tRNA threonylcarbamoyladenosine biosynthesis protein TsaE
VRVSTRTPEDTEALGARLATACPEAHRAPVVLYLSGELGAGKTTFARGFARALGVAGALHSPTYTILEVYPARALEVVHLDLYRIESASELDTLGLEDVAGARHVWLIEWPERGAGRLPAADLVLSFSVTGAGHDIDVRAASALGASWLVQAGAAGSEAEVESDPRTP